MNWIKNINKYLYTPSILLGVSTLVFFIFQIKPGDPSRMLGGQFTDEATLQAIRKDIGLDLTPTQKYLRFINEISPISIHTTEHFTEYKPMYGGVFLYEGDSRSIVLKAPFLGRSYQSKRSVNSIIADAFPGTAILALTSICLALFLGIVFGILSAMFNGSIFDKLLSFFSVIGMSGPSFFIGILVAWVGAFLWHSTVFVNIYMLLALVLILFSRLSRFKKFRLQYVGLGVLLLACFLPSIGFQLPGTGLNVSGSLYEVHPFEGKQLAIHNLILPALTLAVRPLAVFTPMIKNLLLEEMSKDYIRTYRSYGFGSWFLHFKQAFPNILNPVITSVSGWLASLLAGALFVEYIFSWRGLGLEMFEALERDDIPVVMGLVLLFAAIFVSVNALVNQSYKFIDPRLRK